MECVWWSVMKLSEGDVESWGGLLLYTGYLGTSPVRYLTWEQKPEENEGVNHVGTYEKTTVDGGRKTRVCGEFEEPQAGQFG